MNPLLWHRGLRGVSPLASFFLAVGLTGLPASAGMVGTIENQSYPTLCAEVDNINIPLFAPGVSACRIVAMNPRYYPTSISEWSADWEDCTFGSKDIWWIGADDGSWQEFSAGGFATGDVYHAPDNPAAGLDEAWSNFPREINNDWMYDQYIRFTAAEDGDANIEVRIGAKLTVRMALVYGTIEIRALTQSTNGWTDHGSRVFNPSSMVHEWDIPDLTWLEGTDTNVIHLQVVREGESLHTTTNSWAYYDFVRLRERDERGDNQSWPTVLFTNADIRVETIWMDFWWRYPRAMTVSVAGGNTDTNVQFLRIKQRMPGTTDNWGEIFVLYEDGNARIIPLPPEGLWAVPYGASVILGPSADGPRPSAGINAVTVDPVDLSMDIEYEAGGTAHVELRASRQGHVVDMSDITFDTTNCAAVRFRSMWVHDGKSDIDRVEGAEGVFPIMHLWTNLCGTWWAFFKEVPSYHNTYCPEFRVEIMGANQGYLLLEAESVDSGAGYAVVAVRTNASGGQTIAMSAAGGEALYDVILTGAQPDTWMHVRYSDADGGDAIDHLGNTIRVVVDGLVTAETFSVDTGGWDEFETAPSLFLGDLEAGSHTLAILTGEGTDGVELDAFTLVSQPSRGRIRRPAFTRQGESCDSQTNASWVARDHAVGGASMHLEHTGDVAELRFSTVLPENLSNAFLRLRYSDDVGPNQVRISVDGALRAKLASEDTGWWDDFRDSPQIFLGALTAGTHEVRIGSFPATWGVDIDEIEIYSLHDNRPPVISVADLLHTLPVGAATSFVVTASDADGDAVVLTNTAGPGGSAFSEGVFFWTAGAAAGNSTNEVAFVADDGRGLTNSIVTNTVAIAVPADWDGDGMPDGWEWNSFATLTNDPAGDADADGADNLHECISGTDAADSGSSFAARPVAGGPSARLIVVPTAPGRQYTVFYSDSELAGGMAWLEFANTNDGFGSWRETNDVPTTHAFVDDEGSDTTGGPPAHGRRYYRVKVREP